MTANDLQLHATLNMVVELVLTLSDRSAIDITAYSEAIERLGTKPPPDATPKEAEAYAALLRSLSLSLLAKKQSRTLH